MFHGTMHQLLFSAVSCRAVSIRVPVAPVISHYILYGQVNRTDFQRSMENIEQHREDFRQKNQTAFVVGYTGEVGKELVKELARSNVFSKVTLVGRREVKYDDPEIQNFEQKVIDFDKVEEYADAFAADVGFCCLGTTRGKAGADGFYKVDHDYVMNTAKLAKDKGCTHLSVVSSQGANKNSWFLYPKTKGEVEEELKALDFEQLSILRPGVLLCDREERRTGEAWFRAVLKPVSKAFPNAMSTPTTTVAKAMVNMAVVPRSGDKKWKMYDIRSIFAAAGEK